MSVTEPSMCHQLVRAVAEAFQQRRLMVPYLSRRFLLQLAQHDPDVLRGAPSENRMVARLSWCKQLRTEPLCHFASRPGNAQRRQTSIWACGSQQVLEVNRPGSQVRNCRILGGAIEVHVKSSRGIFTENACPSVGEVELKPSQANSDCSC